MPSAWPTSQTPVVHLLDVEDEDAGVSVVLVCVPVVVPVVVPTEVLSPEPPEVPPPVVVVLVVLVVVLLVFVVVVLDVAPLVVVELESVLPLAA
ncbi:hypothetical protein B1991_12945 [Rhodanobacter lindaniclasticus]|uniref:Uncharacterized protein n=1 Tax=Rhodanobacter lindaniclasticus TaxID=75310 RepID=A0A4V3USF4_9GAMM|nr:hypothetical protein B1991_12945 [Rhodanobacter lindaniclasticus]